jgi:imidazole glycerol-phosphate synthase subunit HisH
MLVIVDYGMGNLHSVVRRVEKLGYEALLTSSPEDVARADKIILPGVGAFGSGMQNLKDRGLIPVLNDKVLKEEIPILGICLGMQMMVRWGEEGDVDGLGWINADCVRFRFEDNQGGYLRVPHMGWNTIEKQGTNSLLANVPDQSRFYFVHSYYVKPNDETEVLASTDYGVEFASVIHKKNIFGAQFHPEKSHQAGANLIESFLTI